MSLSAIARGIGRSPSTVSREVRRNAGPDGTYYGSLAHVKAYRRSRRPKPFKLDGRADLIALITGWLDDGWSPRLIALVLAERAGEDQTARVSHETIYQSLYVQARGHLLDLHRALSTGRARRRSRTETRRGTSTFAWALTISERPAEADDRAVPGHWEGDLIVGTGSQSAIGTLVEKVDPVHDPAAPTERSHCRDRRAGDDHRDEPPARSPAPVDHLGPRQRLARWRDIQIALYTQLFFCDPHSPWQRGSNENTNRLLRHWFAKGTDLSVHDAAELRRVQDSLTPDPAYP